ncbi:MAG: trigger factor [Treponema sp.]|nr:trigger factor [Treponema sp.]
MAVSKEIARLEQSSAKLTVRVSKEDVSSQYNDLLAGYSKSLQLRGFRKGKVPKEVLERKFGSTLKEEALSRIIEKSIAEIFEDESFPRADRPLSYSTPQLEGEPALDFGEDLQFSVIYDVMPTVKVETWKGLSVEIPDAVVADEDIDRELETLRNRNAVVQDKDDGAAAEAGDVVTVDYLELSESGEPQEATKREDFVFTLGSGYNMYRFDEEITGMRKGETRDFEKVYPEDFIDKELAGRTVKLRVSLTALKSKLLPELDDDFAQDVDEKYASLEDLKADIRERLTKNLDKRLRDLTLNKLLEKIMEASPAELPESMIRIELEARWRNTARQLQTTPEEFLRILGSSGKTYEEISADWRPEVVKALHSRLIVETLMEEQNFAVTDEELGEELAELAKSSGASPEEIANYYNQEGMQNYLKQDIKERKLFDLLLAENTVTKGKQETYLNLAQ